MAEQPQAIRIMNSEPVDRMMVKQLSVIDPFKPPETGKEALNLLSVQELEKMGQLKFTDRRERKVCECVMIMVFY